MVFYPNITISTQERLALCNWIESNKGGAFFSDANMGGNRVTTRYASATDFNFPEEAYSVRNRVSEILNFPTQPSPSFKDGMVASYALPGDTCYAHLDPRWHKDFFTVHCNIIVSAPESGGDLVAGGVKYSMPEGRFICYPVSEVEHETLLVQGDKPRLMWVFGFCVTPKQYENAIRKFQ